MVGEDQGREAWWTMLKTYGVDGHCTNFPKEMISWLKYEYEFQQKSARLLTLDTLTGAQHAI
jgi:hypothetical protein